MKKIMAVLLALVCLFCMAACGAKADKAESEVKIDYGTSELYTKEDMDAAIELIQKEFSGWEGCELHSIRYSSDEECNADNIAWMNEIEEENDNAQEFTQCIMFYSDFHSPKEGGGAWEEDTEYTDWNWWLARSEGGSWKLMTWGY